MASSSANGSAPARKTALVTGGASGIGLAMVEYFVSQGYRVAVLDITPEDAGREALSRLRSGAGGEEGNGSSGSEEIVYRRCDVASWREQADGFRAVHEALGRIDVVCANAGVGGGGMPPDGADEEPSEPDLSRLRIHLDGVVFSVKLARHYMNKNQDVGPSRGSIICTASNAAIYPFPAGPLYAASKAGVVAFVRSMAPILAGSKMQINALAPAVLATNIAPDEVFKDMTITPMSTLVKGVAQFVSDPSLSGELAEIHGDSVTLRPPHAYVDEATRRNMANFEKLGHA